MSVLMLPLLSFVMTPAAYGLIGLIIPLFQMLQGTATCGLSVSQLKVYSEASYEEGEIHLNIIVFLAGWVAALLLAAGIAEWYGVTWCGTSVLLIFCLTLMQSVNLFNLQRCQSRRRALRFLLFDNIPKFILIVSCVSMWVSNGSLLPKDVYWAYGVSGMCILSLTVFHFYKKVRGCIRWDLLRTFAVIGIPLAMNSFFALVLQANGKFIMLQEGAVEGLAVYTFCISIGNSIFFVIAIYNRLFIPDLFDQLADRGGLSRFLSLNIVYGTWILTSALVCLNGLMVYILQVHSDHSYKDYITLATLTLLSGVAYMAYNAGLNILAYDKRSFVALMINVTFGVVSILCNWLSFVYFGVYGVAISQALLMILMGSSFLILAQIFGKIQMENSRFLKSVLVSVSLLIGLSIVEYSFGEVGVYVALMFSAGAAVFFFVLMKKNNYLLVLS